MNFCIMKFIKIKNRKEVNIMLVIMDEIEVGMRIRKLNKDEEDNRFIKIEEGYKGVFFK